MHIDVLPIGLYEENGFILHDNGHVLIVDPGRYPKEFQKKINGEVVDGILLTHGHEDHILAVDDLADLYDCPVYLHEQDQILVDPKQGINHLYGAPIYHVLTKTEDTMQIGSFMIKVHHTPGHTSGSVCYQYKDVLFTGDTLFAGSIGRTDLYSGNEDEMIHSLHYLMNLPGSLKIFPGHGPASTISLEMKKNPFLLKLIANQNF